MRTLLAAIAGLIAWLVTWVGIEKILSAIWPDWFGAHQAAFQAAIEGGSPFTPDSTILLIHIAAAAIVSLIAGWLSAVVARENNRAPLILGFLLVALGLAKAAMSWPLVPIWYHVIFTAVLLPMAIVGGRVRARH